MGREAKPTKGRVLPAILPDIRSLIEMSRHHVAVTANLALVNLYWNIGRIVTQDIQKNEKRAGYGEQLLDSLATSLAQEYGRGYSVSNLNDMRRFYEAFKILQTVSVESRDTKIRQTPSGKSTDTQILQALPVESSNTAIRQAMPAESSGRILIDFSKHFHLGWTYYRLLLSQNDLLKRKFYSEKAAAQRWSVRELQRQ
jgi:DUF1016 N-terminal domain